MHRIIVSDIFGRTKALEKFATELPGKVEIVDPYNSEIMEFDNENDAYSYFSSEVGLDVYTETLSGVVKASTNHVSLLGFSIGASAIWKLSTEEALHNISGAVLFYGSQIRHYTDIVPVFPVCLVFPEMEAHFSVSDLADTIKHKEGVKIHNSNFLHGFMNPQSINYNSAAYIKYR